MIKRGIIAIAAAALFLPFSVIGSHAADLPTAVMSLFSSDFSAFNYNANGWLGGLTAGAHRGVQ